MERKTQSIRIELTDTQKETIRNATGREIEALEFTADALEDRIAPARHFYGRA
jgi:hypothetical protein